MGPVDGGCPSPHRLYLYKARDGRSGPKGPDGSELAHGGSDFPSPMGPKGKTSTLPLGMKFAMLFHDDMNILYSLDVCIRCYNDA